MKAEIINKFILNFDFTGDWKVDDLKLALRSKLGEMPAIKCNYERVPSFNEKLGVAEELSRLKDIDIIFTDIDDKIKKLSFNLDV